MFTFCFVFLYVWLNIKFKFFFKFLWIIVLGILWSLYWTCTLILVEWPFLTILILTINEQRRSFHLLVSLQFIFLSVLRFSLYKSFTCDFYFYFIFIPRYMLIWLWLVLFPWFLYPYLLFRYGKDYEFCVLTLYLDTLLTIFTSCRNVRLESRFFYIWNCRICK